MEKPHQRRSRMHRTKTGKRVELTPRDIEIFKLLRRYRYLRSTVIHAFVGGTSVTRFKERLGHLYHEGGYLNRPEQQWQFFNARYMPAVYETTKRADEVLRQRGLLAEQAVTWLGRGELGAHRQFAHALMICDILASIELGVRERPDLRFIPWQEILAKAPAATRASVSPMQMPVSVSHRFSNGSAQAMVVKVVPDALFGLEYMRDGQKTYRFCALEADRGTMPAVRTNLRQTSYLRKSSPIGKSWSRAFTRAISDCRTCLCSP